MAVKAKRIKCARCGQRETVTRGERGPVSIYCNLCRDEVKREQNALRAQAYRQRRRNGIPDENIALQQLTPAWSF